MPSSTPAMRSAVDGPPAGAERSDTFAIRCSGMWLGPSENAHPLDRAKPLCRAIRRSSW